MFDPRDDARDCDGREDGRGRVYDERDRDDDPRKGLMRDLDLPRGEERELVVHRDRVYELDGDDSRTLAAVGAFRVVPEHDLDIDHDTLKHLHEEGLVEMVALGDDERGLTLTREGRDLLDSHSMDRDDEASQAFFAGVSRERELDHDSNLYATYRQEEARLRDEYAGIEVRRVVLEQDLKCEYQEFLQEHNRGRSDSDGRPDRDEHEIREWAREHDLPYFDGQVHFVRCETCGRPLTGSWSKGRNGRYAYYHCPRRCRAINVSKAALEGAFVDELALLQPTPGYMRVVKDRVLYVWEQECAAARERTAEQERRLKAVRLKLDRLDEAFLYSESIDLETYGRQRDKLREELTFSKIDYHTEAVEEVDVEGIASCGLCGGGLVVETSSRKGGRLPEYVCHRHRHNGTCPNGLRMPLAEMNDAVLQAIEEHALTPEAVEQVVLLTERDDARDRRAELEHERADVSRRLARLVEPIETGDAVASLVARVRDLEARQAAISAELASLRPVPRLAPDVLADRLAEWRRLLRQSTTQSRAVLQRVLRGRITFTPLAGRDGYTFAAPTRFDKLFSGFAVSPEARPAFLEGTLTGSENLTAEDTGEAD